MRELLLEGRVSWRSERSGHDGTLSMGPARIFGLRRMVAALGFATVVALIMALVALAVGAVAAGIGARWAQRRREQGLDSPIAVAQQRFRQAREWLNARWSPRDDAPGSDL